MERAVKTVMKRVRDEFTHVRGEYPVNHRLPRFQPPR
jgi:hypothetical protein